MDVSTKQMVSSISISMCGELVIQASSLVDALCMRVMCREQCSSELQLYSMYRLQKSKVRETQQVQDLSNCGDMLVYTIVSFQKLKMTTRMSIANNFSKHLFTLINCYALLMLMEVRECFFTTQMLLMRLQL